MTDLQRIYNINPRRLHEILNEVIAELGGMEGVVEAVRKEKVTLITDLFRVKKLLACQDSRHLSDLTVNLIETFDEYYDMDLPRLETKLALLSARLNIYMKQRVAEHNGQSFWKPFDNNFR